MIKKSVVAVALIAIAVAVFAYGVGTGRHREQPITLIVAYSAGGGTDITARLLAKDLSKRMGRLVQVENITGGGGWNGWSALAHGKADGSVLGYINIPNIFAGYMDPHIGRPESLDSFTLLMSHVADPCIWAVRYDSPLKSVADVIVAARTPRGISVAAHGYGGDDYLEVVSMEKATGVHFRMIHNKGTADSKAQLLGGFIDVLAANVSEVAADHKAGQLRVLGVMSATPSPFLPDVPTFKEQGFDQEWNVSRGIAAPKGLPGATAEMLIQNLEATIASKDHQQAAAQLGMETDVREGKAYAEFLKIKEQQIKTLMGW
jgi:tripartite-type tricarboxylate transporter receptor subunit TctC